jgi:hypothetical protein
VTRIDARGLCPATDHAPGVRLSHSLIGEDIAVVPAGRPEEPRLAILADAGRVDISVKRLSERVMAWHGVVLTAFLVQLDGPAARLEVLDCHLQGGIYAGEALDARI